MAATIKGRRRDGAMMSATMQTMGEALVSEATSAASPQRIFLSYSRAQYYFAEDLADELQARGFDAWFDAARLLPGSDWQRGIADGIRTADVLVIVASREAFASSHVSHEWLSAVRARKRLAVALFEDVDMPDELSRVAAIADFRRSWRRGMTSLTAILRGAPGDDIDAATVRVRHRTWSVNVVLATFSVLIAYFALLAVVDALVMVAYAAKKHTIPLLLASVYAVSIGVIVAFRMRGVARRRFKRRRTLVTLLLFGIVVPLAAAFSFESLTLNVVGHPLPWLITILGALHYALAAAAIAMAVVAWALLYRSRDFRRWLPTGEGRNAIDALASYLRHRPQDAERVPGGAAAYRLVGSRTDQPVLDLIRREFRRFGLCETMDDHVDATTVIVVSRSSTLDAVTRAIPGHARVLPVIVSNDVAGEVANCVSPFQWVDYRRRHRNTLRAMARRVRDGLAGTRAHPHDVIPEKLTTDVFPRHVSFILACIRVASAVALWLVILAAAMMVVQALRATHGNALPADGVARTVAHVLAEMLDLFIWNIEEGLFATIFGMTRSAGAFAAGAAVAAILAIVPVGLVAIGNGLRSGAIGQWGGYVAGAIVLVIGIAGVTRAMVASSGGFAGGAGGVPASVPFLAAMIIGAVAFLVLLRRCAWLPAPARPWPSRLLAAMADRKGWVAILRTAMALYLFLGGIGFFLVSMISF